MIELCGITKVYKRGARRVCALSDLSLRIDTGEKCAVCGASGSGKSTLLNILGCLDTQTSGDYYLNGVRVTKSNMRALRRDVIGFIFQSFELVPHMTALENVQLPLMISGVHARVRREKAAAALISVGLGDRMAHFPGELSGGQKQRVAIARALVKDPPLLLADEPCGNLDPDSAKEITDILLNCGKTLVLITHDVNAAAKMPRIIKIENGELKNGKTGQG